MSVEPFFDTVVRPHPLRHESRAHKTMTQGVSIADIIADADIDERFLPDVQVVISIGRNSSIVPRQYWDRVRPQRGALVEVFPKVEGPAAAALLAAVLPQAAGYVAGTVFGLEAAQAR